MSRAIKDALAAAPAADSGVSLTHAEGHGGLLLCQPDNLHVTGRLCGPADVGVTCPSCLWAIRQAEDAQIERVRGLAEGSSQPEWGWFAVEATLRFVMRGQVAEVWLASRRDAVFVETARVDSWLRFANGIEADTADLRVRAELHRLGWVEAADRRWHRTDPIACVEAKWIDFELHVDGATYPLAAENAFEAVREAQQRIDALGACE